MSGRIYQVKIFMILYFIAVTGIKGFFSRLTL